MQISKYGSSEKYLLSTYIKAESDMKDLGVDGKIIFDKQWLALWKVFKCF